MIPRKRPRTGESESAANMANREMRMSNSTLQRFTGGPQKAWMSGSVSGNGELRTRPQRPAEKGAIHQARRRAPELNIETRWPNSPVFENSATSATTPLQPRSAAARVQTHFGVQRENEGTAMNSIDLLSGKECRAVNQATVLPSPAPSEEAPSILGATLQESALTSAIDQAAASPGPARSSVAHNPVSARTPVTASSTIVEQISSAVNASRSYTTSFTTPSSDNDRLRELAARFGGIEGLERQLSTNRRSADSTPLSQQSPLLVQSPVQGSATSAANTELARSSTITPSLPVVQRNSMLPPAADNNNMPPSTASSHHTAMQHSTARSATEAHLKTASAIPSLLNPERLLETIRRRRTEMNDSTLMDPREKLLEEGRLTLLAEACRTKDWLYLRLHQLFCLSDLPGPPTNWYVQDEEKKGFEALSDLLVPNSCLNRLSVEWFVNFPTVVLRTQQGFQGAFGVVRACLTGLAKQWPQFRERHRSFRLPPHVDDILRYLVVESAVLQRVIFKSLYRAVWPGREDECFDQSAALFENSQRYFSEWRRANSTSIASKHFGAWHKTLLQQYRLLLNTHCQHTESNTGHPEQHLQGFAAGRQQQFRPSVTPLANAAHFVLPSSPSGVQPPTTPTSLTQHPDASNQRSVPDMSARFGVWRPERQNSGSALPQNFTTPVTFTPNQPSQSPLTPTFPQHHFTNFNTRNPTPTAQVHQGRNSPNFSVHSANSLALPQHPSLAPTTQHQLQWSATTGNEQEDLYLTGHLMQSLTSVNALPVSPNGTRNMNPLLFPPAQTAQTPPIQQNYQLGIPLHQAYLRDTVSFPTDAQTSLLGEQKYFGYFSGFLLRPVDIKPMTQNVKAKFKVDAEFCAKLPRAQYDNAFGGPPIRKLEMNSMLIRVRSIRNQCGAITESTWAVSDTEWPASIALIVNDINMPIRRKADWNRDLAVDVTSHIKQGENYIRASFLKSSNAHSSQTTYALAVEFLSIADRETLTNQVQVSESAETRKRILKQLNSTDDEIQVVSNDLVVKVTDPFSAQLLTKPVRGQHCVHYECFDLDIFLQTRKANPLLPEQFRCPICGSDARPLNLRVDEWFVEVLRKIKGEGETDAKAIVVNKEAGWSIKEEEKEGESGDGAVLEKGARNDTPGHARRESTVIEID